MTNKSRNSDAHQEFKVPPAFKFQEGEKVLCFHGPLIYEAKCLQSRYDDEEKTNKYHIHYSGWNKSWDEWVPESRVLKHNEGNIQRQKELHKAQKAEPKGKKGKKRSVTGKEKETDGKEKDADDSRSSTPVNEKGGGSKASASATQSSSQESASDIPKRKRSKLDPSVETTEESSSEKKDPPKTASWWKVSLSGPAKSKKRTSDASPGRTSPEKKKASPDKKASLDKKKKKSPEKKIEPQTSPSKSSKKTPAEGKSPQKARKSTSPVKKLSPKKSATAKKPLSPSKLYPVLKGRKLSVKIDKLDMNSFDEETGSLTPPVLNGEIDDLTMFGAYVVDQLRQISDQSKVVAMKIKIQKLLTKK
uniref:Chromo domain-containing protein n=1 Tax=Lygus hesperus TaxID=30085 RepID=A0A0K8SCB6_LYGHE